MEKPNLNLPLATSYNQRGVQGDTNAKAGIDQRKINCIYKLVRNSITGNSTLYLTKRPGVTKGAAAVGTNAQQPYLAFRPSNFDLNGGSTGVLVVYTLSGDVKASIQLTVLLRTATILAAAGGRLPAYIDQTLISSVVNYVVQLVPSTGAAGGQRIFFSADANTTWTEITDADLVLNNLLGKMEHMDGYAFILNSTNTIQNSDLNSLSSWTATSFLTKQIQQDFPVGLAKLNNQILGFGQGTMEVYYNAGNPSGSPLSPIRHLFKRVGLVGTPVGISGGGHYYCTIVDRIFFVGREGGGSASVGVYTYNGSTVEKVSTPFIDSILGEATFYSVNAMGIGGRAAVAIMLTDPTAASQRWLMFFPEWKEWFEWTSSVFFPSVASDFYLGLSASTLGARIYSITAADNWQDDGTSYQFATQFKLPSNGNDRKVMASFGVKADTARSANTLLVEASDDDFVSFRTIGTIDLTKPIKASTRGGSYIDRCIRLSNTNAVETRLQSFVATIK